MLIGEAVVVWLLKFRASVRWDAKGSLVFEGEVGETGEVGDGVRFPMGGRTGVNM